CAVQSVTGAIVCWAYPEATSVGGAMGGASAIAVGYGQSCAIQAGTNAAVCWGTNPLSPVPSPPPPPTVNGPSGTASAIPVGPDSATGTQHSCAIQAETGGVECWPLDSFDWSAPSSVNGESGTASAVAVGSAHACAIQAGTGAVVCWGANGSGQATPPGSVN